MKLRIVHLYPRDMNLYGDTGNVLVLRKRLEWRGHEAEVVRLDPGSDVDLRDADVVLGGGGSDAAQHVVADDLHARRDQVREALAERVPMLLVCGTFQLFGTGYRPAEGDAIDGIGVFDATTTASSPRIIGRIAIETALGRVTGFENHGGATRLGPDQAPFGRVVSGVGNGDGAPVEGAVTGTAIGTYLHGPVLPTNPALADHLLTLAMRRHDPQARLEPLGDVPPETAAQLGALTH